jgi:quercetin dioxygenase-like cupin family protein
MGDIVSALYGAIAYRVFFFNSLRFLACVPQIAKAIKDQSGAEAISFGTWTLFLPSHASAMAYAVENQGDWKMASLFLSNAPGCGTILPIAAWKHSGHRRRRTEQAVRPSGNPSNANYRPAIALLAIGVVLNAVAVAQTAAPGVVAVTPAEMKWASQGGLAAPGMEQLNLLGDPAKPGPYTLRLKFPKGFKIAPHTHPDSREVTILSGTFATGYGEKFDAANLKTLPAGSFYTEPANVPHYIAIEEDTILQVSGMGPSGRRFVNPPETPK